LYCNNTQKFDDTISAWVNEVHHKFVDPQYVLKALEVWLVFNPKLDHVQVVPSFVSFTVKSLISVVLQLHSTFTVIPFIFALIGIEDPEKLKFFNANVFDKFGFKVRVVCANVDVVSHCAFDGFNHI
jgi:hypothetical protein